jgi:ABC-type lipoprotein export system ATPase subunit
LIGLIYKSALKEILKVAKLISKVGDKGREMNYSLGSSWRKWDLHVHTPVSLVQYYGGVNDATWEKYICDLEALPPEFKVLGINDYIFIDGYKRLREEKSKGRLKNIDLLLPVIELRINIFGGTSGDLSRINFHVIFSDQVSPENIETQFINAISSDYKLSPQYIALQTEWAGVPTRQSLIDLGDLIIQSVPAAKRKDFGTPLIEGFNNLNFNFEEVYQKLEKSSYFKGKYFTAVGKTEWANINWNDQSIAEKKNVINKASFVFISSEDYSHFYRAKKHLYESKVNDRLLDCSDAHYYSNSAQKDRIGKCFTWIKADTTFEGLRQILYEPERIFIGEIPEKTLLVQTNRTKFIKNIALSKAQDAECDEKWFDDTIDLNPDLVAIIGNKGSGKSALADILGLLGNSHIKREYYSFLNDDKFCQAIDNKAKSYKAKLQWESGQSIERLLSETSINTLHEGIRYIPQNYFEIICNEIADKDDGFFDKELKKVIFSHVSIPDRLGKFSLQELITTLTQETEEAIQLLKRDLSKVNSKIIQIEEKQTTDYTQILKGKIKKKNEELKALVDTKPIEVKPPDFSSNQTGSISAQLEEISEQSKSLSDLIYAKQKEDEIITLQLSKINTIQEKLENYISYNKKFAIECDELFSEFNIRFNDVIQIEIKTDLINEIYQVLQLKKKQITDELSLENDNGIITQNNQLQKTISDLRSKLDEPNRKYHEYIAKMKDWEKKRNEILGNAYENDSLEFYKNQLEEIKQLPSSIKIEKHNRDEISRNIYGKIRKLSESYKKLYEPVQVFIETHPIAKDKFAFYFDVSILESDFQQEFFDNYITRGVAGSFCGIEDGNKSINNLLHKFDFNSEKDTFGFIDTISDYLQYDRRDGKNIKVEVPSQLKKSTSVSELYDFIYSLDYLRPHYILRMGDKELSQLSPGEKGTLLLVFYLLIDKDQTPLIIDQPEHNLDNQTIYNLLVNCVKEAKQKRQVIIVTHNPNLAVVCDAEQIIYASIDKADGNKVKYIAGAIENPIINEKVVDVLEGTRPAFDKRRFKYI